VKAGTACSRDDFKLALDELYRLKGWDPTSGAPTRAKLESLELGALVPE
jgi:aldehyde:ferredoxin oxidoreductase